MDLADRLALGELPARYGDLIDDRNWRDLDQIFLPDATFDIPGQVLDGLAEIRTFMTQARHPRTHIMTNIYVDETPDGVILRFRLVGMRPDGRISTGRYRDVVVKRPEGWRVVSRVFTATPYEDPA
ncbi:MULTISPECIES: nuclear transport factor 2 family protein [unclassified Pseudofrankia]|uniref:nuclear transport factor 2 family protein n=1 Tax=unclassified Pseudofrankia TaxID=2994372 RepID=UPI0008D9E6C9|nr:MULTISPECIES: nuclear transport factor 2 family protein [unclassified Pseudofrankia]MDT3440695.1 nuclear transport factor 2 family protein [Pseudofrankia sp. BMG5.37]OHV58902.1 hypothetical protein BCD48_05660 [Pseudofrankia sp. BMG5.36]